MNNQDSSKQEQFVAAAITNAAKSIELTAAKGGGKCPTRGTLEMIIRDFAVAPIRANLKALSGSVKQESDTETTAGPDSERQSIEHPYLVHAINCTDCSGPNGRCAEGLRLLREAAPTVSEATAPERICLHLTTLKNMHGFIYKPEDKEPGDLEYALVGVTPSIQDKLVEQIVDAVYRSMHQYEDGTWFLDNLKAKARVKLLLQPRELSNMTIDERVKDFAKFKDSAAWETYLKSAFQEVARAQRDAGVQSLLAIEDDFCFGACFDRARTTVANATIK